MCPANGVVRECIWTSPVIYMIHHLGSITNDAVQSHHLIVRPFRSSFGARSVIAYNVDEESFIQFTHFAQCLSQSADFIIGLFSKPRINFHLSCQKPFLVSIHGIPGRDFLRARCKLSVLRNDPYLLLLREYLFSQLVPTLIESVLIFVSPFFWNVMRCVARTGRKVNIERFIGSK